NDGIGLMNIQQTIEKFKIPLEEIKKAIGAENFDSSERYSMTTHRGKLVDCSNHREAFFKHWTFGRNVENELLLISSFHHENVTPLIGFYAGKDDVIIASEYALNGSLYQKLETQHENSCLTWWQRLKICLGAARGLKCFHAGFGGHKVIHGDFTSKHILLYDNLEAKICGFGKSFLVPRSYPDTNVYQEYTGSKYYKDPVFGESRIPRVESNVYSFGVVLFEILTGLLACSHPVEDERISMINWVRRYNDEIDKLIDYRIRDEIDARSLKPSQQTHGAASTIARRNQKLEDFRIPLEDINSAIGVKSQETRIGDGGFGIVYKGKPSERWQNRTVAIKCLRPESYQGEYEFRNELHIIFSFSHENIIPFIGYCDEGKEKIIVYEYASNGSLDRHLEDKEKRRFLTWERRLKICLGAARGLDYLHMGLGEDKRQHTQVYTNAAGTNFYMDPVYHESGVLRKESDVYSFGVVTNQGDLKQKVTES
nr:protein kinase, ATP binding site-containing protein [Tanacetum cinerariifolium]